MRKCFIVFVLFTGIFNFSVAQTTTNYSSLQELASRYKRESEIRKNEAIEFANRNNIPVSYDTNGIFYEIQYILDGIPQYYKTDNRDAAISISTNLVYPGGSAGLNLTGSGITAREWDGGGVRLTHQEYGGRVIQGDTPGSAHYHATHVAGTIMAAGVVPAAKGMAYQANLRAFDWNFDDPEMATEAAAGALMSNHSYGQVRGWRDGVWWGNPAISTQEDYLFGFYDFSAQDWDQIAYDAPYYLICKSAGNDRNDCGDGSHPCDGAPDGYDCIGTRGVAKNILTVGAVNDVSGGYSGPSSVVMSSFSGWGPADDGRIKPDIVGNGVGVYSTDDGSDTDYVSLSGTSMSTPSITGSLVLLQEHYENLKGAGIYMRAATLKALVIHTADETGPNDGPDYMFGWGLMNTEKAAQKITEDQTTDVISEHVLLNGGTYTQSILALGTEPLKVTIVWTDIPGTPVSAQLDPLTPMIVNELDLQITDLSTTYFPWKLDRNIPAAAATNIGENNVDNVEVVYISNPSATNYTITVDHDGTLGGGSQAFSMIISGINGQIPPVADFIADDTIATICGSSHSVVSFTDQSIYSPTKWIWTFNPNSVTYVNGTNDTTQNPQVSFNAPGLYSVSLFVQNAFGGSTKINYDYIEVTNIIGQNLPFSEDFESGSFSTNSWTIDNPDANITWDIIDPVPGNLPGTNSAFMNFYNYGNVGARDAIISPGLDFRGHNSIMLSFKHAYTRYDASTTDSLIVFVSTNCGNTWERVRAFGEDGSGSFATGPNASLRSVAQFAPSSINDWCGYGVGSVCYEVNLSPWIGNKSVKVKFESYCNYGNNLFIDDINIEADAYDLSAHFIANDTIICAGESIDFTDMSSGYLNTWTWEFEGGIPANSNQQYPSGILYTNPGTYDVKLIVGNGVNTDTLIKPDYITVNGIPSIITSNDTSICSGDCVTIFANGGISYFWSTGQASYEINVCPTLSTTYSVTITDINGCTNSDEIIVTVNPKPSAYIYTGGAICSGECTVLQAFGGGSYSWSTGESSNTINVCPTISTSYIVTVTNNNGCTASYDAILDVNPLPTADAGPDVTITQGHNTTLTASATGGLGPTYTYVWSTGDQTAQISVFPPATTTYTVTVTDMNGCSDSDEVLVQVNTATPSIITKVEPLPGLFCPGDPVVVRVSATNVYNVGSFSLILDYDTAVLSYQGYTANPGLAGTILFVNNVDSLQQVRMTCFTVFSPINVGNGILLEYSFIHKASSCNLTWNTPECEYTDFISQQQLPTAFINGSVSGSSGPQAWAGGDKGVCMGSCTQLTANGGGTYSWSTGDQLASIVVCPTHTSTYTVTVTSTVGCSASDDVIVTVNPLPTADAGTDNTICFGDCILLSGSGGNTYVWSTGESIASISVCPTTTTIYSLTVTDVNGCIDTDEITISVNQAPQANAGYDKFVTSGSCTGLSASGGGSYLWNTVETTASISVCPTSTSTYTVTVTDANGCTDSDDVAVSVLSQPVIETTVPHLFADSGNQVIVPIHVKNMNNVASIGLALEFDNVALTYESSQNTHSAFGGFSFTINEISGRIILSWFSFTPVTITDDVLLELVFTYNGGSSPLSWDMTPGVCQYTDLFFNILPANFNDGSVNPGLEPTYVELNANVFLQGAYDGAGIMNTLISQTDSFPDSQPFNTGPWNYTGIEQISTVPTNVVDWVLIEIRDSNDVNLTLEKRAGLLLDNGQIVDTDFTSGIMLDSITAGYYYIAVYHLNHLPLMTAYPVMLPNTTVIDFSDTTITPLYGGAVNSSIELETNVYGMIAGDINKDGIIKYSGPGNDRGLVLQKIITESGSTNITTTLNGYYQEDIRLNGKLQYSGPGNDPSLIIQNLVSLTGSTSITILFTTPVPGYGISKNIGNTSGPFDIFLRETNDRLNVILKTNKTIEKGVTDNIQFTLCWEQKYTEIETEFLNYQSYYSINAQAEPVIYNKKFYQTYAMAKIRELPPILNVNDEIIIFSIIKSDPAINLIDMIDISRDNFTVRQNGSYYISVYGEDKTGKIIESPAVSYERNNDVQISCFPNPVNEGTFYISIRSKKSEEAVIQFFDISSRLVFEESVNTKANTNITNVFDVSALNKGTYLLRIFSPSHSFHEIVIVD